MGTVLQNENKTPLVSVIVPVYNLEQYLERCIGSVLAQTYQNLEIILVDDGSTDNSGRICDKYQSTDKRIKVIHKENGGAPTAYNAGLDEATGEIIAFVDGDDSVLPSMFEILVEVLLKYNTQIAICGVAHIIDSAEAYKEQFCEQITVLESQKALEELLADRKEKSYCWNKIYRRSLFQNIRFPVGRNYEDIAVMHHIFANADRVVWVPDALYEYRFRPDSIIGAFDTKSIHDSFIAFRERYDFAKALPISGNVIDICLCNAAHNALGGLIRYYNSGDNCGEYIDDALSFIRENSKLLLSSGNCAYVDKLLIRLAGKPRLFKSISRTIFLPAIKTLSKRMKESGHLPKMLEARI